MKLLHKTLFASLVGLATLSAHAGATGVLDPNNPCNVMSWQISGAIPSNLYTGPTSLVPLGPISSTSCAGVYTGNDGPTLNPVPNLGYLNDGLLNGQAGLLAPDQFISTSQYEDLKTPGQFVDPGWIMLGDLDGNFGELNYSDVTPVGNPTFNLNSVIKYTQTQTSTVGGAWLLEINKDIISILEAYNFGNRSVFDHLAFEVKSGTSWAVYDFDFNEISGFDLSIPYTLSGTWTMNTDFENGFGVDQDISHMSVWARDPVSGGQIPEPRTLFLVGIGMLALGYSRKLLKQK